MSAERQKSPVLGRIEGGKTLVSVTDLVHRIMALEKQVSRIPELEARIVALENEKGHRSQPQSSQVVPAASATGIQDVASLWRGGAATATTINAARSPAPEVDMNTSDPALNRYSSEMNLVEAIKEVQKQTGHTHPIRSVVAQHMIDVGTADKVFKFKTICTRAEKAGLVELGGGNGMEWISIKDK